MKVLFVCSGKNKNASPLIKNQGDSFAGFGISIDYFLITPGLKGYVSSIFKLKKKLRQENYQVVHAHYSLSGIVAALAGAKPLVVSLLGSDAYKSKALTQVTNFFNRYYWNTVIVKTHEMKKRLDYPKALIIPNGINTKRFKPISREIAKKEIQYHENEKMIVFVADPNRPEKNYALAEKAVRIANEKGKLKLKLMPVYNVENEKIPFYINASHTLLLTSKREGGVNVIKEAMACNIPIVSTNVGDVYENTKDCEGCFVCDHDADELAEKLIVATELAYSKGRDRIKALGLENEQVAKKIIDV